MLIGIDHFSYSGTTIFGVRLVPFRTKKDADLLGGLCRHYKDAGELI